MKALLTAASVLLLLAYDHAPLHAQTPAGNKPDPLKIQAPWNGKQPLPTQPPYDPVQPVNYIRTRQALGPVRDEADFDMAGYRQANQTTQYLDGLGRSLQTVSRQSTPGDDPKDVVAPVLYDEHGHEIYTYLPYASFSGTQRNDGSFKTNPMLEQQAFYNNLYKDAGGILMHRGEQFYYGQTQLERSPLNRPVLVMAPGNSWVGSGRGVAQQYLINTTADSVVKWDISNNMLTPVNEAVTNIPSVHPDTSFYAEGRLYKHVTRDEQGSAVLEYRNKQGLVLLKKVQVGNVAADYSSYNGWLCTYYVYDDLNQLRFVIPPKAVEWLKTHDWNFLVPEGNEVVSELCFRYEYDEKQRLIGKKIPGAGWMFMIYDARDRLVLTQDANQRRKFQWSATLYDALNRPVTTGLYDCNLDREELMRIVDASTADITRRQALQAYVLTPLTVTHFDDYSWTRKRYIDAYNNHLDASANLYPDELPTAASQHQVSTTGLVTGTETRVLEDPAVPSTGKWLSSAIFYDKEGRVIQTQAENYKGGTDISITRYDFTGKAICNYLVHSNPPASVSDLRIKTNLDYDHGGRLLRSWKTINDQDSRKVLLVRNEYDELGRLKSKELGRKRRDDGTYDPLAPVERLDYNYNIRGWLQGINAAYSHPELNPGSPSERWFGMELNYDWGSTETASNQYSGNISLINWRSRGDGVQRSYGYSYDRVNRLLGADFSERLDDAYIDNPDSQFDVVLGNGIDPANAYDAAGNILSMAQWGIKPGSSRLIDKLTYAYHNNSNKLKGIAEDPATSIDNKLGDFTDNNGSAEDYGYDLNGNMTVDLNKHLKGTTGIGQTSAGAVQYNHLNLPWKISIGDGNAIKGTITYIYDATGNKLEKRVLEYPASSNGNQQRETITTYLGAFVYEQINNEPAQLRFVAHEEGRIRIKGAGAEAECNFDYFIKDHLGNTRMVLTDERIIDPYPVLSFDGNDKAMAVQQHTWDDQNSQPLRVGIVRTPRPGNFGDDNSNGSYAMLVRKSTGSVGATKLLKVMAGDRVHTSVEYYYTAPNTDNSMADGLGSLVAGIAGTLSANGHVAGILKEQGSLIVNTLQRDATLALLLNSPVSTQGNEQAPKAYLNVLFFDEQFKLDKTHSLVLPVAYQPNQKGIIDRRLSQAIEVARNGYAYVYFSNESNEMVYFDNFMLMHERGPLLEETHYYPYGLTMQGISSKAVRSIENKYKFNKGSELQNEEFSDGSGLELYSTQYRNLDPQMGRFWQLDPKPDCDQSMYSAMKNNPILINDPLGDTIVPLHAPSGAGGTGHMAVLIQNKGGKYALWSKNGTNESSGSKGPNDKGDNKGTLLYDSPSDFLRSKQNPIIDERTGEREYAEGFQIPTNPHQDRAAEAAVIKDLAKPYRLLGSNCAITVQNALDAAGLADGRPTLFESAMILTQPSSALINEKMPNVVYERVKTQNPQGTTIYPEKSFQKEPTAQDYQRIINLNLYW